MPDKDSTYLLKEMTRTINSADSTAAYCLCQTWILEETLKLLKEQEKEIKALRLLVEWAEECDFGYDSFPDEFERYRDEIEDMGYIDGMIHIAKRTLEECR